MQLLNPVYENTLHPCGFPFTLLTLFLPQIFLSFISLDTCSHCTPSYAVDVDTEYDISWLDFKLCMQLRMILSSSWSSCCHFPPSARVAGVKHLIVFGWHPVIISLTPDCRLSSLLYLKIYFVLNYVSMCVCLNRSVSVSAGILASQKRATDPMSWSYNWPWATSGRCKRPDYHLLQEPQVLYCWASSRSSHESLDFSLFCFLWANLDLFRTHSSHISFQFWDFCPCASSQLRWIPEIPWQLVSVRSLYLPNICSEWKVLSAKGMFFSLTFKNT